MKFRIHYEHQDGTEDSLIIDGQTEEEILLKAQRELDARRGLNPWSEELQG